MQQELVSLCCFRCLISVWKKKKKHSESLLRWQRYFFFFLFLVFFLPALTVIAGDLFSSCLTHLIVASWNGPAALHYPVSPFVSKVVKGVSISFLLLSKTLSRVSSSLFTLRMRYWQRCRLLGLFFFFFFFWVELKLKWLKAFHSQYLVNSYRSLPLQPQRRWERVKEEFM